MINNQLLEEDRIKILKEREQSEKTTGKYNFISSLRRNRDQANLDYQKAKEDPDYEKKLDKYEKKANHPLYANADKAEIIQTIIEWLIRIPSILLAIVVLGIIVFAAIGAILSGDIFQIVLMIIVGIIAVPILIAIVGLVISASDLIATIIGNIFSGVYAFFARRIFNSRKKKYYKYHMSGYVRARWLYQSFLSDSNFNYAQKEVIRFDEKEADKEFWNKHEAAWNMFINDCREV